MGLMRFGKLIVNTDAIAMIEEKKQRGDVDGPPSYVSLTLVTGKKIELSPETGKEFRAYMSSLPSWDAADAGSRARKTPSK